MTSEALSPSTRHGFPVSQPTTSRGSPGFGMAPEGARVCLYGDVNFVPTEQYDADTARRAIDDAEFAVLFMARVVAS